jgi:O-antigen/teichoic acid export membrane protein
VTDGRSFVRNSALNLFGLVLPLVVAILAIPPLMRGLGAERFGILTLAWAAIGYFNLFELGLSRALTQAVAHRLGIDKVDGLPVIVWTSLVVLLGLGALAAIVLASATPILVTRVLNVPEHLRREAILSFYILATSLPLVLMAAGMRGIMEAHQHFGMVNALRIPLSAFTFVGPLLVLPFSRSLVPSVVVLIVGRVIGCIAHLVVCVRRYDYMRAVPRVRLASIVALLRFGGWTTVTNIVSPLMVYMDRFLIAAILPIAAVAHYVTPYEVVTKFMVIPGAILGAAFPAFAATFASNRERMAHLYDRSQRTVVLMLFPLVLVTIALAHEGLRIWMGGALPPESATVLQWLALGIFINSIAYAPLAALQSAGRPDLIAKLHLLELPFYAVAIWFFARSLGLVGVAIAWTLRVTIDTLALLFIAERTLALPRIRRTTRVGMFIVTTTALVGAAVVDSTISRTAYVVIIGFVFVTIAWRQLLTANERVAVFAWVRSLRSVTDSPAGVA